jgi:FkbM family methyltransferase
MQLGKYAAFRFFAMERQEDPRFWLILLLFAGSVVIRERQISTSTHQIVSSSAVNDSRSQVKPSSQLSPSFLECMQDVGRHLPVRKADGELVAHHYLAGRPEWWNEGIRFSPFGTTLPEAPLILDIGGNTVAADSREFLKMFPGAEIHVYEPVPPYVEELRRNWREALGGQVHIHDVGFGDRDKTIRLPHEELEGQSTFIMDSLKKKEDEEGSALLLRVVDARDELRDYLGTDSNGRGRGRQRIDLLHMNCEGCEWEALMRLVDTDMLQYIGVLQVSFHNYGAAGIGELLPKCCLIREVLEQTHQKMEAIPFGWERWVRKALCRIVLVPDSAR